MTNVALISRWINQCRGVRETQILAALLAGIATALIAGCQKPEHELCTSTGEPSELWSKYDLPKVEGAELCSEYEAENGHGVTFIHHHDREHSYTDYSDPYEEGFTERGWRTAKVTSSKSDWGPGAGGRISSGHLVPEARHQQFGPVSVFHYQIRLSRRPAVASGFSSVTIMFTRRRSSSARVFLAREFSAGESCDRQVEISFDLSDFLYGLVNGRHAFSGSAADPSTYSL